MKNEFESHIKSWQEAAERYSLPKWEELPSFELYMDQVTALMKEYLKGVIPPFAEQSRTITPPMINNYVKLKAMPAPNKKKYSKIHLAYLIMISSLKQALSIPTIQRIIPVLPNEEDIKKMYEAFCENQKKAFAAVTATALAAKDKSNGIAVQSAVSANIFKVLTEDISEIIKNEDN